MIADRLIRSAPVKLSTRVSRIGESATLRVSRRAAELKARGISVVDFGAGEPDFASPRPAVDAACRALNEGFTRYTPGSGIPDLRAEVAASYQRLARWCSSGTSSGRSASRRALSTSANRWW